MFVAGHTSCSHSSPVNGKVNFVNMLITYYILFIIGICNFEVTDTSNFRYCKIILIVTIHEKDKMKDSFFKKKETRNIVPSSW